jgi:hypothetical protein
MDRCCQGTLRLGTLMTRIWRAALKVEREWEWNKRLKSIRAGLEHWLQYADFYQWPHLLYFDRFEV